MVITSMSLIEEMVEQEIDRLNACTKVHCKLFEDSAAEMTSATIPKIGPRTKYRNVKYLHFRENLNKSNISIHAVLSKDQIADPLTKPLAYIYIYIYQKPQQTYKIKHTFYLYLPLVTYPVVLVDKFMICCLNSLNFDPCSVFII